MVGVIGVIGIVKLVVFAEIHFADESAFGEQRQRSVNRGPGDRLILLPRPCEQLVGGEMLLRFEDRIDNGAALQRYPEIFALQEVEELLFSSLSAVPCHSIEYKIKRAVLKVKLAPQALCQSCY